MHMRRSLPSAWTRAALLLIAASCGGDDKKALLVDTNTPKDAGLRDDAGHTSSAGSGGKHDAGGGGRGGAGGTLPDGGPAAGDAALSGDDAGEPGETNPCKVAEEQSELTRPIEFLDEAGFAIAPGVTGFGLAYQITGTCVDAVANLSISGSGELGRPGVSFDECNRVYDVSLQHESTGFRLAWTDNTTGRLELYSILLSNELAVQSSAGRKQITMNTLSERGLAQATIAGTGYLAWLQSDSTSKPDLRLQRSDGTGNVRTLVAANSGYEVTRYALAQLGKTTGALAFISEGERSGLWLQPLDEVAAPSGTVTLLNSAAGTANTIDLATRQEDGGAVVYSVSNSEASHDVRFRRLNANGAVVSDEVKITPNASDPSLARLGDGYVIAYRTLPTDKAPQSRVSLTFVTKEGNTRLDSAGRLVSYPIADAGTGGGRITARVSVDGQLLVVFVDGEAGKLRVIRKRLDCAL
jgi:hypothetical protein